jgi:UDP-glucose 4-epimerase
VNTGAGHDDLQGTAYEGRAVVVTGGAGFIGSHLVEELDALGAQVAVVDNLTKGKQENLAGVADRVDLRELDVRDPEFADLLADARPHTVYHLAGFASVPDSVHAVREDFEQNAEATLALLEAVRHASPDTRVVFTSSAAVYGEGTAAPLSEAGPTVPLAPYGVSKLAGERYTHVYARVFGLRTAVVRFFPVFGPRLRRHVIWDLMRKVDADPSELTLEGDGEEVRDVMYVANAVAAMLLVTDEAPFEGEVYNASDGRPVTIRELAGIICRAMGVEPRLAYTGAVRPGVSRVWIADTARLRSLGFRPRVSLEEGIEQTVEWFRAAAARR